MRTIWKYKINDSFNIELNLPKGSEILSVHTRCNKPIVLVLVDPTQLLEKKIFYAIPTGGSLNNKKEEYKYIGTYFICDEYLERIETTGWHLFEIKRRKINNGE